MLKFVLYLIFQINSMEKEGKAFIEKEMSSLKTQLQAMTEKCHALQLENELTKSEHNHLKVESYVFYALERAYFPSLVQHC